MLRIRRMRTEGPRSEFYRNSLLTTARFTTNSLRGPSAQPGTTPVIQTNIQGKASRRSQRVASTLRGLTRAGVGDFLRLFGFV